MKRLISLCCALILFSYVNAQYPQQKAVKSLGDTESRQEAVTIIFQSNEVAMQNSDTELGLSEKSVWFTISSFNRV